MGQQQRGSALAEFLSRRVPRVEGLGGDQGEPGQVDVD